MNFNAQLSVRLSPSHLATLTLFSPFPILLVLIFAFSLCMLSLMYLSFPLSPSVSLRHSSFLSESFPKTHLAPSSCSFPFQVGMIDVGEKSGTWGVCVCVLTCGKHTPRKTIFFHTVSNFLS